MPTVLDEFVVRLGLDSSGYRKGRREAEEDFKKTQETARKTATNIEDAGKKAAVFYTKLRNEVVSLFAAIAVGTGFANLIRNIVSTEAQVGRLSKALGVTTETLTAWQSAAKRTGGSAEATAGTFQSLTREFQNFALTGQSSVLPYFRFLQVAVTDTAGKIRPLHDIFLDLSEQFSKMDPRRAHAIGANMGIDPGTMALLLKGPAEVRKLLEEMRKLGLTTQADADAGQQLENQIDNIQQAVRRLAQSVLTDLGPQITAILGFMEKWLLVNRKWLEQEIASEIKRFRDYVKEIDWKGLAAGAEELWAKINKVVDALGGWVKVGELLFAAWAVSKLGMIAAAVGAIGLALSNPVILAALAAWTAYYLAAEKFHAPTTREEYEARMKSWGPDSPLWQGIPRDEQLRFPNSPASRGGESPAQRMMPWLFPPGDHSVADVSMDPYKKGFLETISHHESKGSYTVMNGGEHLTDYAKHPGRVGKGGTSTAAGRYQFTEGTWNEVSKILGLTDFTPQSQDKAAWFLAEREYRTKTGRDLRSDLETGGFEDKIADALKGRWSSMPGGKEPQMNTDQFRKMLRSRTEGQLAPQKTNVKPPNPASIPNGQAPENYGSGGGGAMEPSAQLSSSNQTTFNGPITIQTAATDANGISLALEAELKQRSFISQVNTGLT